MTADRPARRRAEVLLAEQDDALRALPAVAEELAALLPDRPDLEEVGQP